MINEFATPRALGTEGEPTLNARFREQLAREPRLFKARTPLRQPPMDTTLLRDSWIAAAAWFARPI